MKAPAEWAASVFAAVLSIHFIDRATAQNCFDNNFGGDLTITNDDNAASFNVLLVSHPIACDGYISAWTYRRPNPGGLDCEDYDFTVWRLNAAGEYYLVGHNHHPLEYCADYVSGTTITFGIAPGNRIPVQQNDVIGFYVDQVTHNMIAKDNTGGPVIWRSNCGGAVIVTPGNQCGAAWMTTDTADIALRVRVVVGDNPTIDNLDSEVSVYENDNGAFFTVVATHPMNRDPLDGMNNDRIDGPDMVPFAYSVSPGVFAIGANGAISAPGGLNYEATPNQFTVDVTVTAMSETNSAVTRQLFYSSTNRLVVNVIDLNEIHTIDNLDAAIDVVVTGTLKDTEVYQIRVTDPDAGNANPSTIFYSMLSYEITTPAVLTANSGSRPPFRIDSLTGQIFTSMDLVDYVFEEVAGTPCCPDPVEYEMVVHANDGQFDVFGTLTITLINTRQPPAFSNLPGAASLSEEFVGGSAIYGLESNGPEPANIRYSLIGVTPNVVWHLYTVDEISGDVNVKSNPQLDILDTPTGDHVLTIAITDGVLDGTPQVLTVDIRWANRPPQFEFKEYVVTIPEKCGATTPGVPCPALNWIVPGITPTPITVTDRDVQNSLGPPDAVRCTIRIADGSQFFTVSPATYRTTTVPCDNIEVTSIIDVDAFPHYKQINLTLQVQDRSNAGDTADLYITVTDVNDNVPTFDYPTYEAEIEENTRGGVSILTVFAEDQPLSDTGEYAEVTYGIVNALGLPPAEVPSINPLDFFQVDPQTGVLSTKQPIDYEAIDPTFVVFDIQAIDNGGNFVSQSSLTRINITILDVNDNRPEWDCSNRPDDEPYDWNATCFYNLELRDDINIGYMVQQFKATDVDTVSPTVTFFLLKPNSYFMLTKDFGEVFVKWDLETYTRYILYCFAQDNGNPNLMTHITWVRIDTFPPRWHLVDITLNIPRSSFNDTVTQQVFIDDLRAFFASEGKTWWAKWERITGDRDKTTVTIYALEDTSTYYQQNLHLPKKFVHRDDLLRVLRHNIRGVPRDELVGALTYTPIKVMPTYINWFLDTIEGIITLTFLCLIALALLIFLIVIVMKKLRLGCFKEKPKQTKKAWPEQDGYANPLTETEMQEVKQSSPTGDDDSLRQRGSTRAETREARRPSLESIHSAIVRPSYDPFM